MAIKGLYVPYANTITCPMIILLHVEISIQDILSCRCSVIMIIMLVCYADGLSIISYAWTSYALLEQL